MTLALLEAADLASLIGNAERLVLLLDGGLIDDLSRKVRSIDVSAQRRWVYEDTEFAPQWEQGPLLVECGPGSPLLASLLEVWAPLHAGVLMMGSASLADMQAHWRQLRHAVLPDGRLCLFRPLEPRKLRALLSGMTAAERNDLLGPVSSVIWREHGAHRDQWLRLTRAGKPVGRPWATTWKISPAQQAALDKAAFQDHLDSLTHVLRGRLPELAAIPLERASVEVRRMAESGRSLGYVQPDDMAGYIELLFRHNALCTQPGALQLLITDTAVPAWKRLERAACLVDKEVIA